MNLVDNPAYSEVQAELDARVLSNMEETGETWGLQMDFPPRDFLTYADGKDYLQNTVLPSAIEVPRYRDFVSATKLSTLNKSTTG